uniref:Uncharacterized protein n=1 Tax=Megaviridae environmental sample TaxID=1737588 RepID=A0A5J6VK52_9VIRU|nr:MAG: hypothetical protein [Megaviridae environmental sample]
MKVLSWDVGIVNLAYCLFSTRSSPPHIIEWKKIDLFNEIHKTCIVCGKPSKYISKENSTDVWCALHREHHNCKKLKTLTAKTISSQDLKIILIRYLERMKHLLKVDVVLIENQPSLKNPKMKSLSNTLFDYYYIRGKLDAKSIRKIKYVSPMRKNTLIGNSKRIKKQSVEYVQNLYKGTKYLKMIRIYKKKDDLCDAFIQGYHWISTL